MTLNTSQASFKNNYRTSNSNQRRCCVRQIRSARNSWVTTSRCLRIWSSWLGWSWKLKMIWLSHSRSARSWSIRFLSWRKRCRMHLLFSWVNSRFTCSRLIYWKSQAKNPLSNSSQVKISRNGSGKLKSRPAFQRSKACVRLTRCGPNSSTSTSRRSSAGLKNESKRIKNWWANKLRFRRWPCWLDSWSSHSCRHSSRTSHWLCRQILPNQATTATTGRAIAVASLKLIPNTPQMANNFHLD